MSVVSSLVVEISSDISGLSRGINNADRHIDGFTKKGGRNFASMGAVALGVGAAVIGVGVAAIDAAVEWETAFAGVEKTVDASAEELDALEQQLRDMATNTENPVAGLENAHETLAKIAELGGSLGIHTEDIASFTQTIAMLDMATDLTAESAATMTAQFANITGMPVEDYDNFGATLVDLGNKMAATEPVILEFAQRMAGAGENAGLAEPEILAFASAMASLGLDPEAGGTSFSQTMNTIVEAVGRGGPALETLSTAAGTTADAFREGWADAPAGMFVDFLEGLGEMAPADRIATLDALGLSGVRVSDMLTRMSGNTTLVSDALSIANDAWEENTALTTEAEKKFATTEAQMNLLGNNVRDLGIELGEVLLPVVNDVVAGLTGFIQDVKSGDIEAVGNDILNLAEGISGVELPDFETVISGWQTFGDSVAIIIQTLRANIERDMNNIAVGIRSTVRDIEEGVTRVQLAATDAQIALGINYDANVAFKDTELVPRIQGIEAAEMLEQQIRDSMAAGDLSIDMSQFVTSDPAVIAAKIADPLLIQAALNTALAEGDQATFDVLAPVAMELGIDTQAIQDQYQAAIDAAAEETTFQATVTADITVRAGRIDFSAVSGSLAAQTVVNTGRPVPALATGGYIQQEGLAYLHSGERVLNAQETQAYQSGRGANGGGTTVINIYAQSVDQILAELNRRGLRVGAA